MPRDEHGNIVIAKHLLTSVFQQRREWARLIPMDGVTRAIVNGMACYPQKSWRTLALWKPNPPGWNNPKAKAAIWYKFGQWVFKGDLEVVLDGAPRPLVIKPQSFVGGNMVLCSMCHVEVQSNFQLRIHNFRLAWTTAPILERTNSQVVKDTAIVGLPLATILKIAVLNVVFFVSAR
jgi:hypothetical protein